MKLLEVFIYLEVFLWIYIFISFRYILKRGFLCIYRKLPNSFGSSYITLFSQKQCVSSCSCTFSPSLNIVFSSMFIASFPEYTQPMIEHLVTMKINHWDG